MPISEDIAAIEAARRREVRACLRIPERPEWGVYGTRAMKSVFAVECGERHSTT